MIPARRIHKLLAAKPFKPFRVFLSDGSFHNVPHPEFAWVFGGSLFVGVAGKSGKPQDSFVEELSILHITRIAPLPPAKAGK
jgi:hypothetical protein